MDATKHRIGADDALQLLADLDQIVAMRGKKVEVFDLRNEPPDQETILARLLGPTGNLRAPTARVGRTLLVGFNEEVYRQAFAEKH